MAVFPFYSPESLVQKIYVYAFRFVSSKLMSYFSVVWDFYTTQQNVLRVLDKIMFSLSKNGVKNIFVYLFVVCS